MFRLVTNKGIIAGGGWGMYDFDHGQDGSGGWVDYGSGGAPFGEHGGRAGRASQLFKVADSTGDTGGGGNGGNIGMGAEPVPRYAAQNRSKFAIAGCPYIGSNIKINNVGNGKVLGDGSCPSIQGF